MFHNSFTEPHIILISKLNKNIIRKKLHTNIVHKHRYKYTEQYTQIKEYVKNNCPYNY